MVGGCVIVVGGCLIMVVMIGLCETWVYCRFYT